ncbi:hypothetical protein K6731_14175 [Escherichia whittamii]|uniref:DUF3592 domain-containing protein n=1 Tax=Escherichia whittamii TaxID=2762229 RepID=A0ABR8TG85_9ESCH|nr:hypothetical protein [Escherichia whittamii]MBD7974791.1 hypothetical protein [Escherichia whittamii]MCA4891908.1 hypothetical protein [Escherichia whittamii]MEB7938371.1 hypothetical protein [Escherichia whittamii]
MIDFLVSFIILLFLILPSFIVFCLFSCRYMKMMRAICFTGAAIFFIVWGYTFFQFEYGITHRGMVVQGTIIDRDDCTSSTPRGSVDKGYCASVSYLDHHLQRHTLSLPFRRTDYIYFNHATVVYDRDNPQIWRIIRLDDKAIKIDKSNSILLIWSIVLLMWGGVLQLVIGSPVGKKYHDGDLIKDISLLLSYIWRKVLCR